MPNVSIIMPVYNKSDYLAETFDALLCQSYKDWELIVVDDGSTDGSSDIIKRYVRRDSRVCCIKQNNRGVSAARNTGLKEAAGEWIWFVDADDLPDKEFLAHVFWDNDNDSADLIVGNYQCLDKNGTYRRVEIEEPGLILSDDFPDVFMKYQYKTGFWGFVWNKLIKRSLLSDTQIKFQEGLTLAEDLKFMVGLYRENINIYCIPYNAMRYTVDAVNASGAKEVDYWEQLAIQIEIKNWIVDHCQRLNFIDYFKWMISRCAAFVVFYGYENNEDCTMIAKALSENREVNSQLCIDNVEPIMRPIVWCLIFKTYILLRGYLSARTGIRKIYRKICHWAGFKSQEGAEYEYTGLY